MESFNNEIQVQQGEDWNLDVLLSQNSVEYIPFIISNQRTNPFFVVTVASTKYEKNLRYVASWWNDLSVGEVPTPTFFQTVPQSIGQFASLADIPTIPPLINGVRETSDTRMLYQFTLSPELIDEVTGHKPYHYLYYMYHTSGNVVGSEIDTYQCRIRFNFASTETSNWASQNYMYQITLVSGELMANTLDSIALAHGMPANWPTTVDAQYIYVKMHWPTELQPDIDINSPLGRIETPQVILQPTKLFVFNNLRQLI